MVVVATTFNAIEQAFAISLDIITDGATGFVKYQNCKWSKRAIEERKPTIIVEVSEKSFVKER